MLTPIFCASCFKDASIETEFASPGLYGTPSFFRFGTNSLISSRCSFKFAISDKPVTFPPGFSKLGISFAASGSVTAEKTTGISFVALTTACAEGVAIATITSGLSPTSLRAICVALSGLP